MGFVVVCKVKDLKEELARAWKQMLVQESKSA